MKPMFQFGLLADVQYADKDTVGARRYKPVLELLRDCVDDLNQGDLAFVIQCGDLIDGNKTLAESHQDLDMVLGEFSRLNSPVKHVIGNHCLEVPREQLMQKLEMERGYYSFQRAGWKFVILDSMEFSICGVTEDDPRHQLAATWLAEGANSGQANAKSWNGGLGKDQREWLRSELKKAELSNQHVIVFSHLPVLEASSTKHHLLWDHAQVLEVLDESPAFAAWVNGHDHAGGFAMRNGRAFLTLPGMVEAKHELNAYAVVDVFANRLEVRGVGEVVSRTVVLTE